jgi:peptidoglycan/LPS O-acetylase OafA/YrhL
MREKHKYRNLDGLRGLAALSVVILHYVTGFAPFLIGAFITQRHTSFDHIIATTPLQLPTAGDFAVCIFFVLSGFVLSLSFFRHKDSAVLVSSAARRYFRLMFPALGSIILAYVVLRLGLMFTHQAAIGSQSTTWLGTFWNFPAHFGQAVFQGLYGIWFGTFNFLSSYNVVLWTMHFELYGSFLVFMFLALFGKMHNRWLFYAVFAIIFLKTYYLGFIVGIAISDIISTMPEKLDNIRGGLLWLALPFGLTLGAWTTSGIYTTVYSQIHAPFFTDHQLELFAHMIGAIVVVLAVLKLGALSRALETRLFQYLGRISFSLYLTHFAVMSSLGCYIFYRIEPAYGYKVALFSTCFIALPVTFLVASAFTRFVDVPSIAFSKKIGNRLVSSNTLVPNFKRLRLPKKLGVLRPHTEDDGPVKGLADVE